MEPKRVASWKFEGGETACSDYIGDLPVASADELAIISRRAAGKKRKGSSRQC